MTYLLELRERLIGLYGRYEAYAGILLRFTLAFFTFLLINSRFGYMERLNSLTFVVLLSVACGILPQSATLLAAGVLITLHCYAVSLPTAVSMLAIFAVMYVLYFRFAPRTAYCVLLTPMAFVCGIPYVMPVANGLLEQPYAVLSTLCGAITYFFLRGITTNASALSGTVEEMDLVGQFHIILNQLLDDKELLLTCGAFIVTALVVYVIRRLSVDHAWTIAIGVGLILQFLMLYIGYVNINLLHREVQLLIGSLVSVPVLAAIQFIFFNLDYTRSERVQFEDDEYYYYVKAVPKRYVPTREKVVKKISGSGGRQEEDVTKKQLMEDMDIHVDD